MSAKSPPHNEQRQTAQRPVHEMRVGRIKAAIWANQTDSGVKHNVTFSRIYKDGKDWKDTSSFGRDDLLVVAKLADMVHTWIFSQKADSTNGDEAEPF